MLLSCSLFAQKIEPVNLPNNGTTISNAVLTYPSQLALTDYAFYKNDQPAITSLGNITMGNVLAVYDGNILVKKDSSRLGYHIKVPERSLSYFVGEEYYDLRQLTITTNLVLKELQRLNTEIDRLKAEKR